NLVFVDPKSSTQADGAHSSRVTVPLPEDPYEAIRHAYLDGTDTESGPFEDLIDTETPELPLTIALPISLSESTPPVLVPILRRTARIVVRVPHAMSSGLSASMEEVAAMSESAFHKRFRTSCESSPSVSPPDLPSRKRYRGTFELVKDSEEEEEEDEDIEESMDSDSLSEDTEDEGPTTEDEDPAAEDEGLTVRVEGPGIYDESYGLYSESHGMDDDSRGLDDEGHSVKSDGLDLEEEEEAIPGEFKRPKRVSASRQPTLTTWTDPEDSMVYIDVPVYPSPAPPVQTPPSPEWTSGSLPISLSSFDVLSPISSPMIPLTVPSPVATPATAETKGFLTELGAQVEMQSGAVREEIFSRRYRFKSPKYEQERVAVTFRVIWRPMLALESWAGQTDAWRAALWHVISVVQGENQDLRLQLAEERHAQLELVEVVDDMKRG
ncbi:hypothetical protein Tco_1350912, partial [Tanacetum coccineum]